MNDDDTGVIILLLPLLRSSATRSSSFAVINVADSWCAILVALRRGFCDVMRVLYNSQKQQRETKTIALFSRRRKRKRRKTTSRVVCSLLSETFVLFLRVKSKERFARANVFSRSNVRKLVSKRLGLNTLNFKAKKKTRTDRHHKKISTP